MFIQLSIHCDLEYEYKYSVASIINGIKLSMQAIILMNAEFNEDRQHWILLTRERESKSSYKSNDKLFDNKSEVYCFIFGQKNRFSNRTQTLFFLIHYANTRHVSFSNMFICPDDDDSDNNNNNNNDGGSGVERLTFLVLSSQLTQKLYIAKGTTPQFVPIYASCKSFSTHQSETIFQFKYVRNNQSAALFLFRLFSLALVLHLPPLNIQFETIDFTINLQPGNSIGTQPFSCKLCSFKSNYSETKVDARFIDSCKVFAVVFFLTSFMCFLECINDGLFLHY